MLEALRGCGYENKRTCTPTAEMKSEKQQASRAAAEEKLECVVSRQSGPRAAAPSSPQFQTGTGEETDASCVAPERDMEILRGLADLKRP